MNNNEQLFEMMTKMYAEMQNGFKSVNEKLDVLDTRVTFIEENHGAKLTSLDEKLDNLNNKTTSLEVKVDNLDNKTTSLEVKLDNLDNKLDDNEASNASRHVLMVSNINEIKTSISNIQIITAQNWGDIARLKVGEKIDVKY